MRGGVEMSIIHFQKFSDDDTFIKGYIDTDTKIGYAETFRSMDRIHIDISRKASIPKNPYTDKQFAHSFANEVLESVINSK
jgi:hypothetical protein